MARQERPVGLIIAGVALVAAGLLLWMILRSGDDGASASPPQPAPQPPGAGPGADRQAPVPRAEGSDRPNLPKVSDSDQGRQARPDLEPPTETVVNGVRVRDHRRDRSTPYTPAQSGPPAFARKIKPELTGEIVNRFLPYVRECGKAVPPEARGQKPRFEGTLVIAIKNHQVSVREATIELTDVIGAHAEPTQQCLQQKAQLITAPAADEDDLDNYPIRISYALP